MIEDEIDSVTKQFKEVGEKVNDFTTVLNKYNLEYEVFAWESAEGMSIKIGDIIIDFFNSGAIEFNQREDE